MIRRALILACYAVTLPTVMALSVGSAVALPHSGQLAQDQRKLCAEPIRRHERAGRIPDQLLAAMALAESGRWDKTASASFAWPWTVTAEGKGQFLATKSEAIAHVQRLRARGVRNIDVGCMQINLMHHPEAFSDLEQALDPEANVAYATSFLTQLFDKHRSWIAAVGHYHSATPEYHMRYRQKVTKLWNDERRRAAEERRQDVMAAYQQRRQQALALKERVEAPGDGQSAEIPAEGAPYMVAEAKSVATPPTGPAVAAAQRPQLAPLAKMRNAPVESLRVETRIPPATSFSATAPAGRIAPRPVAVPLERRF